MSLRGTHRRWIGAVLAVLVVMLVPWQRSFAVDGPVAWSPKGPFGGHVSAIAIDPVHPDIIYAGTGGGVYRSDDAGAHWRLASEDFTDWVQALAIDPDRPNEIYAGTYVDGVFKSEDAGQTWQQLDTGEHTSPTIKSLAIIPPAASDGPTVVYVGTASSLLRSLNRGVTWQRLGDFNFVNTIAIHPRQWWVLYLGTNAGLYKSFDYGDHWASFGAGIPEELDIQSLVIDPQTPSTLYAGTWGGGVYKSVDDGLTWTPSNQGMENSFVYTLAIDPQTPTTLYAGTDQGVFKSEDGAATWRRTLDSKTLSLSMSPGDARILYAGLDHRGVMRSEDAGESWTPRIRGLTNSVVHAIAPVPGEKNGFLVGTDSGLWMWDRARDTWQRTAVTDPVMAIVQSPSPSVLYAASCFHIYKSEDSGATWQSVADLGRNRVLAVHPQDDQILYVGTWSRLYKSRDGGVTWEETGLTDVIVGDILIDPNDPQVVYVGTWGDDKMYKSEDGGASWRVINRGITTSTVTTLAMDPDDASVLYAGSLGGSLLFKSEDAGESWRIVGDDVLGTNSFNDLVFDARSPKTLYAATYTGLFQSTDGGEHWRRLGLGKGQEVVTVLPDPYDPNLIYAGAGVNGLYEGRALSRRLYLPQLQK